MNDVFFGSLTNSDKYFIIDAEDKDKVLNYKWCLARGAVYSTTKIGTASKYLSFLLTGKRRQDHINRDKLDNRKSNFRNASNSQNGANKLKLTSRASSKFKCVFYRRDRDKWVAQVCKNQVKYNGGCYSTEVEAAIAANILMKHLFGEFAVTNSIPAEFLNFEIRYTGTLPAV